MRTLCLLVALALPVAAQQYSIKKLGRQPLTNESIMTLAKAGFDELFILQLIRASRTDFDISVQGLVALKQGGISEDLIRMIAMPPVIEPSPAPPPVKKHSSWLSAWLPGKH
jgi:hypothetical protein